MKRNSLFEDSWKQCNEEAKLAKIQLKNIQQNVAELLDKIEACDELDAWVQSYLTKADDYLDSVKKYVVFGQEEETTVIEPIEIPSESPANTPTQTPAPAPTPEPGDDIEMPSIDQFDPDVKKTATDLTPEVPTDGEEDIEGAEAEDITEPEDDENGEVEDDAMEPDDFDDEEDIEMPSIDDFDLDGDDDEDQENIPMDLTSKKKGEEDEVTFDDIDYFNTQEFMDPEDDEKVGKDFDKVEEPNKSTKGKK